jgi:predicted dehydrogenase/threonine dehydrogenase-like Zn-dependent dehydrogenase
MIQKARARPDLVRQVIDRARTSGIKSTVRAVQSRLSEDMPLGYSAAGVVAQVGEAVAGVRPGQRVATAGAPHADQQIVAANLVTPLPDGVSFEEGAFATVGSIALNGHRLADVGPGARILVVGLGLVGQLTARLAVAAGGLVAGIEPDAWKRETAREAGIEVFDSDAAGWELARAWRGGEGADAVIVTAATKSSEPLTRAAEAVRDRGIIVLVGDVGMELDRRPFYDRELTLRVARSYGPGRYDPAYEDLGVDYPVGHVRWTAQRNMEAVLDLIGANRLAVADLITHRRAFQEAPAAYAMLEAGEEPYLGIILEYEESATPEPELPIAIAGEVPGTLASGLIGTGRFARDVLVPAATEAGFGPWLRVHSATGSGGTGGELEGAARVSDPADIAGSESCPVVFVATRHDTHARYAAAALDAGQHVFCEKPLAIAADDLDAVEKAWQSSSGSLMVGFNRRWSPAVADVTDLIGSGGPLQLVYRVNAGELPEGHWLADRRMGGRLLGEACHFVDTCTAIVGADPATVSTLTSGQDELLLDQDFTVSLGYPDGSQATVVYASHSSTRPGKERLEVMGRGVSLVIDDYQRLDAYGPSGHTTKRYRPADKGHGRELEIFAEVVRGERDRGEVAATAFHTSRVMFAAVESAMTGAVVPISY